jgi:hypothetical protein
MINDEYKKILRKYHKLSDRHILVAETDMPYPDVLKVVALSDKIRKAGNELVGLVRKNYEQLMRTKRYRKLLFLYGNTEEKSKRKDLAVQLNVMQKSYNVTWDYCRTSMISIGKNTVLMLYLLLLKPKIFGVVWKNVFMVMEKHFIFQSMEI